MYYSHKGFRQWLGNYYVTTTSADIVVNVPDGATHAMFCASEDFWVDDKEIQFPPDGHFEPTTVLANPIDCTVDGCTQLHVRSRENQDIFVAFYSE